MKSSHSLTEKKYDLLREQSLNAAQQNLPSGLKNIVQLKNINSVALAQAMRWEDSLSRSDDADWSWSKGLRDYAFRHPKRFELAIWFANAQLCGLSIGKPTFSGSRMRLDVIEGAPWKHPLKQKIVEVTITAAAAYAFSIGAEQLRIMRPVNDVVTRYYQGFGFTLRTGKASNTPTYLWKNL